MGCKMGYESRELQPKRSVLKEYNSDIDSVEYLCLVIDVLVLVASLNCVLMFWSYACLR